MGNETREEGMSAKCCRIILTVVHVMFRMIFILQGLVQIQHFDLAVAFIYFHSLSHLLKRKAGEGFSLRQVTLGNLN